MPHTSCRMPDVLYINGRFTTTDERVLGVEDRGFQFGDAVYEVLKFLGRRPAFLLDHYRRMESGLREIEIRLPWTEGQFSAVMRELLERTAFDEGIVYIQVSRGEAPRAHFWPDQIEPTVVAYSRAFRFPDAAKKERGIRTLTTPWVVLVTEINGRVIGNSRRGEITTALQEKLDALEAVG